jgi:3',5'-nucleoside bisphosphate phosphatase
MHIDLHTHSTASDGLLEPAALVRAAHESGLDVIALTDHDSIDGVGEAIAAGQRLGVEVIAGVEINTDLAEGSGEAHILGYFLHWQDPALQQQLAIRRAARERRGQQMVAQLNAIGIPITWDQVRRHADGAVGRPHVAAALIDLGIVTSVDEAFAVYLGRGKPGYVKRDPFTPQQAIALIQAGGGVASLAHPAGIPTLETLLVSLVGAGLVGLETYYGQYDAETIARLLGLCQRFNLVPTGGSDYHGPGMHPTPLGGQPPLPESSLEHLRQLALRIR